MNTTINKILLFFKTVLRIFSRKWLPESRKPQMEAFAAAVCGCVLFLLVCFFQPQDTLV